MTPAHSVIVPPARWLASDTPPQVRQVIVRALADIGICEMPEGSNRSGVIDGYNTRAGAALGSYWCASALACWAWDCGLWAPPRGRAPSCDEWVRHAKLAGRWHDSPLPGRAVIYHAAGNPSDANHCGLVVRALPVLLSVEGNTTVGGTQVERNGYAVALKRVNTSRVLGYVELA